MSLFSAFAKTGLNFVTKLGEIVAPLEDDEEDIDDSKAAQMSGERLTSGDEPSEGANAAPTSMMSHFTTLTTANLPGIFKEMGNDTVSRSAPPRSNDSSGSRTRPVDSYNSVSQQASSCMVEVELDESFESTTPLSPSFEEVHLVVPTEQLFQEDIILNSETDGAHYTPRSAVRQLSEPSLSPVYIPPDKSHQHPPNDFVKPSYVPSYVVSNPDHKGDSSGHINTISPISVSSVAFQPIANSFPMYKPPSYAPSSSQKEINLTASNTPTESEGNSYRHHSAVEKESFLVNESDVFIGNQSNSAINEGSQYNNTVFPPPAPTAAGAFFDLNDNDSSVINGVELMGENVLGGEQGGRSENEIDFTTNSSFPSNMVGIQENAVQNIPNESSAILNEYRPQNVLSERTFLSEHSYETQNQNESQGEWEERRDVGSEKVKNQEKGKEDDSEGDRERERERQKENEREALIEAHAQKDREVHSLSALLVKANGHIDELKLKLDDKTEISDSYESQILKEKEIAAKKSEEFENLVGEYKDLFMRMGKQGEILLQSEKMKEIAETKIQRLMNEKEEEKEEKKKEGERLNEMVRIQAMRDEESERSRIALVESYAMTTRENEELKSKYEEISTQFIQLQNESQNQNQNQNQNQAEIHDTAQPSPSSSSFSSVLLNGDSSSSSSSFAHTPVQPLPQFTQIQIDEMHQQKAELMQQNIGMQQQIADMAVQLSDLRSEKDAIQRSSAEEIEAMRVEIFTAKSFLEMEKQSSSLLSSEFESFRNNTNNANNAVVNNNEENDKMQLIRIEELENTKKRLDNVQIELSDMTDMKKQLEIKIENDVITHEKFQLLAVDRENEVLLLSQKLNEVNKIISNHSSEMENLQKSIQVESQQRHENEKIEMKMKFDQKLLELLENEKINYDSKILKLQESHSKKMEEERKLSDERGASLLSKSQKESAEREKGLVAVHAQNEGKANSYEAQLRDVKQQLLRSETESRQLHQVIAQLRNVRKSAKDEGDGLVAERDELKASVEHLSDELRKTQLALECSSTDLAHASTLSSEVKSLTQRLQELETLYSESERKNTYLESELYVRTCSLEASRADGLLVQQDLEGSRKELGNLHEVLRQLQWRSARDLKSWQEATAAKDEEAALAVKVAVSAAEEKWNDRMTEQSEVIKNWQQKCQDEELFRRQAEIDLNSEKRKMQRTLEGAVAQLRNSQEGVVDRTLIANLLVSYFARRRSMDVLSLIAKILSFTDEQLETVGLKVPSKNIFTSIISTFVPGEPKEPTDEGDTLAELWLNFLLLESEVEMGPDGKPIPAPDKSTSNLNSKGPIGMTPLSIPQGSTGPSPSPREVPSSLIPLGSPSGGTLGGKDGIGGGVPFVQRVPVRYSFTSGYASKDKEKEIVRGTEKEKEKEGGGSNSSSSVLNGLSSDSIDRNNSSSNSSSNSNSSK